jgi:hypothetical protein
MEVPEIDPDDTRIFHVSGPMLKAEGDIYWENADDFEKETIALIESRYETITLDISQASFISSNFVGCLSSFALMAGRQGKRIKIIVSTDVSWLFDIMGELDVVELEIV